jgi:hypothetical protein
MDRASSHKPDEVRTYQLYLLNERKQDVREVFHWPRVTRDADSSFLGSNP